MKLDYILPITIVTAAFGLGLFFPKHHRELTGPAFRSQDYDLPPPIETGGIKVNGSLSQENFNAIRSALAAWAAAPYNFERVSITNADGMVSSDHVVLNDSIFGHCAWNLHTNIAFISVHSSTLVRVQSDGQSTVHSAELVKTNGEWRVVRANGLSGFPYPSPTKMSAIPPAQPVQFVP